MLTSLKNLKTSQKAEFISLFFVAFMMPISWNLATYGMIALFVCYILRIFLEDGFKINEIQYKNRAIYFIFIVFWLVYAISFLYSENSSEARIQIGRKLSFLLFPLFFLFSDLSYLTKDRIKIIIYGLIFGIFSLFMINIIWAGIDIIFNDNNLERLISPHKLFKTNDIIFPYVHRAYFSIITCFAFVFCFTEIFNTSERKTKIFNIISATILILIPFFLLSRAGVLCTILTLILIWVWITFIRKEKRIGIISGSIILITLIAGYLAFPKTIERFGNTFNNIKEGKGDCRITIRNANRFVIKENLLFGVGIGDRNDKTLESYEKYRDCVMMKMTAAENVDDYQFEQNRQILLDSIHSKFENKYTKEVYNYIDSIGNIQSIDYSSVKTNLPEYQTTKHCIKYELNAHNQFNDTIISVGLVGLLILLTIILYPIFLWIKHKKLDILFFSFLFIITISALFESIFERQMGIMFFVFFYFLLFHGNFCQQTKSFTN